MDDTERILEFFKKDRFAVENGMEITEVRPGAATARMKITGRHLNGYGTVQGGAMFTLADYAFAAAANAFGRLTVSSGGAISFFCPPRGGELVAKAALVSAGHRLCTYCVDLFDGEGTLVGRYTGSGYIKDEPLFDKTE